MKAILIDPDARTVSEVEYDGDFKSIYSLIDCEVFTCLNINQYGDALYVDDEALINGTHKTPFIWKGHDGLILGKGLILGTDDEGASISPTITVDEVKEQLHLLKLVSEELGVRQYAVAEPEDVVNVH